MVCGRGLAPATAARPSGVHDLRGRVEEQHHVAVARELPDQSGGDPAAAIQLGSGQRGFLPATLFD
jgi:hypothetical protein